MQLHHEGIEMDMGAFGSPPIFSTAGIMGGYPAAALRVWAGRTSNLAEVIARGDPLPSTEGPIDATHRVSIAVDHRVSPANLRALVGSANRAGLHSLQ